MIPNKLQPGDEIRVIAPSRSMGIIGEETKKIANKSLSDLGFKVTFGKHAEEKDDFCSSSIESRVADLHEAFLDDSVKGILTVIGGFNSNQLLRYIDWDLIKDNPKVICGFSDITALNNSMYTKTGLVSYSGPHYSTLGQKKELEYTLQYFRKCLMENDPFEVVPSKVWTDDEWYLDQDDRNPIRNKGWIVMNDGEAVGTIIGSNLGTFNLLRGTEYFPELLGSILFIEDDLGSLPHNFDRDLQALIHLPSFDGVKGIVIGRFQKESRMSEGLLREIIKTKKELNKIPIISEVDFGHTEPKITFPIGGRASIVAGDRPKIQILEH